MIEDIRILLHAHPALLCVLIPAGWAIAAFILGQIVGARNIERQSGNEPSAEDLAKEAGCFLVPIGLGFFGITWLEHKIKKSNMFLDDGLELEDRDPIYGGKK